MKICILGDTHFGMRNDSVAFLDFGEKFYNETFFPYLIENNIKTIIQLGDFFDRRKYINFYSLKRTKEMFLDKLIQYNIEMIVLAGNHDTYFKNTNEVNSIKLLLEDYENITVIDVPQTVHLECANTSYDICIIPWICADNYDNCMNEIKNTTAPICMGHFEISGFAMHRGQISDEGLSMNLFDKFQNTFSGHYHHKSTQKGITYVGTPMEMTWQDYSDPRGFHLFDLDSYELVFVQNPNVMFHRIIYDDKQQEIKDVLNKDLSACAGVYVKVVVVNKTNPYLFDQFMNKIYGLNPLDITIVEDALDLTDDDNDDRIDEAEDTVTIINKYVDALQNDGIDNNRLKSMMRELYVEALNLEQV